ncbi:hypothetical protein BC937DRAFT_94823 [Endogone sp. FLAS-F59071]|nr:hypothetical protein BC937DRAFT_94823 [Endogone sp. FLAS-F59071]|eukprot:RUS13763.1 hypothetical protein BC937DRAFT_94823 [Endogone sp. FLAS-F59071]
MADQERKEKIQQTAERATAKATQISQGISSNTKERVQAAAGYGSEMAEHLSESTRGIFGRIYDFLNKVPPLKYGVYTMAALSAIPLATFLGFLGISFAVLCGIATVVVSLLEGGAVLIGGTFLIPTLFVAGVITFFIVGGFLLAWVASFALARLWAMINYLFSFTADEVQGDMTGVETGIKKGYQRGRNWEE